MILSSEEETQPLTAGSTLSVVLPKHIRSGSSSSKTTHNASHTIQIPPATTNTTTVTDNNTSSASTNSTTIAATAANNSGETSQTVGRPVKAIALCCITLVLVLAVFGLTAMISFLVTIEDAKFHVESVSVFPSDPNASNYQTTSAPYPYWNMNVSFVVKENLGNRMYYDMVRASLFYEKQLLSSTDINPFYQDKGERTSVNATFGSWQTHVDDWVATAIDKFISKGEAVKFNVKMQGRVTISPESSSSDIEWMRVTCGDIKVAFLSNNVAGAMPMAAKKCKTNWVSVYEED